MAKKDKEDNGTSSDLEATKAAKLDLLVSQLSKDFGAGTIMSFTDGTLPGTQFISSGAIALDRALGGGYPRGRIVEMWGNEGCLDQNTKIKYRVISKSSQKYRGGTIKRLFERFHGWGETDHHKGKYFRPVEPGTSFTAPCMNDEGRIFHNKIVDVVKTGNKECLQLTTQMGLVITATLDHKFFTGNTFTSLGDLARGDQIFVHNNTPFRALNKRSSPVAYRSFLYVKHHPTAGVKVVRAFKNRTTKEVGHYSYHRLRRARAVIEAHMNGLQLKEYLNLLNGPEAPLDQLTFLDPTVAVHHLDEDFTNDTISNLIAISSNTHNRFHAIKEHNNLRFTVVPDRIVDIQPVGCRKTYDLKMQTPFNNYIADGLVVHNSGKSTLALHAIAEAQKLGGTCLFIDAEHALSLQYAQALGVDTSRLLFSQPDSGETALQVLETAVRSGVIDVAVVDSVAALLPRAELEGQIGDQFMGLQARLMSQAMRKLAGVTHTSNTLVIFINQTRSKIGGYGNPVTVAGGNALKFYASQRLEVIRTGTVKNDETAVANTIKVKVGKNKIAPPYREAEFSIVFGKGIDQARDFLNQAQLSGLVEKKGSWYAIDGKNIAQGEDGAIEYLETHPEVLESLKEGVANASSEN